MQVAHSLRKMPCDAPVDYSRRKYHRQPEGTVAKVANPFQADWKETGRQGMKELNEIIPLLHRLRRPTFFTHDLGFFDHALCHKGYTLICLDVRAKETAVYIRRCLRHPEFQAEKQRLGKVILARQRNLSFWEIGKPRLQRLGWP